MKIILDIPENKAAHIIQVLKSFRYIKAKRISNKAIMYLKEIEEMDKAFKHAELINAGKLKSRPAATLIQSL